MEGVAGLDRDQVRVEVAEFPCCAHPGDDGLGGQGAVQEQHPDQGSGAWSVSVLCAGGVPEPLMDSRERA